MTRDNPSADDERAAYERWAERYGSPPECIPPLWQALSPQAQVGWVEREKAAPDSEDDDL